MLPSYSSADSNMRKGTKRKRSNASNASNDNMQSDRKRETKHCVREGRWPCHPLVTDAAAQANLEVLALQLGLHGISDGEVRELGLWIYFKSNEVNDPRVCGEARSILDTKLEEADMYQHLSFFRKMLPDDALSDMHKMLHHLVLAKAHAKRSAGAQQDMETSTCKHVRELASMTYWSCTRHSLKNAHSIQVEWLNGACAVYSSNKTSRN